LVSEPVPSSGSGPEPKSRDEEVRERKDDIHWRWRMSSIEHLADNLDPERFGVKALYLVGSTKNATAGPKSDIDIIIHFQGSDAQRKDLMTWLEGWSLSLGEANYLRTGYKTDGLLDVHILTDADIRNRTSWAMKISAVTDVPRPMALGRAVKHSAGHDAAGGAR
jgi:pyruvate,water dikinase